MGKYVRGAGQRFYEARGDTQLVQTGAHVLRRSRVRKAGKFPQPGQQSLCRAAAHEHAPIMQDERDGAIFDGARLLFGLHGQRSRVAEGVRVAEGANGAIVACWIGRADERAQPHHGLIVFAGPLMGHQKHGLLMERLRRADFRGDMEHARQHARLIAVQRRNALAVGDGRDRARGISAHARQRAKRFGGFREFAVHLPRDQLRRGVQVARAGIVAHALPELEHLFRLGVRQIEYRRERAQEGFVIALHRLGARLLKHDFGKPDAVGVCFAAPRKGAGVRFVPAQKRVGEAGFVGLQINHLYKTAFSCPGTPRPTGRLRRARRA